MINSRHRRFYSKKEDQVTIAKLNIKSGMIVEFNYRDSSGKPSKPLVFVMDTDEYVAADKKKFMGINLNYLPHTEIEKLFTNIGTKVGWKIDKQTNFPKVNLYEEEDIGMRPRIIFKPFVKNKLLNRFDCWRTYKYDKVKSSRQIKYRFQSDNLLEVYEGLDKTGLK